MKTAVMVWGASSGAGKSLLTTALCRWASRQGLDVAPFKAQNMSNNARVVPLSDAAGNTADSELGEIGSAQYFQALAARVPPHVDMNPVLLKPERDTASQVVVHGRVDRALSLQPWRERSVQLAAAARHSFQRLAARHDVLVIEGAGSPAEINLAPQDYVNLHTARWAQAHGALKALLVVDIDRGGAFAHVHGTWALLPHDLRPALAGYVLNKFRGDAALLAPGPADLQALTGLPLLGVLPMKRDHGLPDEDGLQSPPPAAASGPRVAIVAWPHLSNLDEFQPLHAVADVRWVRSAAEIDGADWVVLPGSKQVSGDLAWLRAQGLDRAIDQHARAGRRVLGICGGLQVLGAVLDDPDGVDGDAHGPIPGLGLLPLHTRYAAPKLLRATALRCASIHGAWQALSSLQWQGYEIRSGRTSLIAGHTTDCMAVLHDTHDTHNPRGQAIGWSASTPEAGDRHNVMGIAAHGLFEDAAVLRALFGQQARTLDDTFNGLADLIDTHLGAATLRALFEPASGG